MPPKRIRATRSLDTIHNASTPATPPSRSTSGNRLRVVAYNNPAGLQLLIEYDEISNLKARMDSLESEVKRIAKELRLVKADQLEMSIRIEQLSVTQTGYTKIRH